MKKLLTQKQKTSDFITFNMILFLTFCFGCLVILKYL